MFGKSGDISRDSHYFLFLARLENEKPEIKAVLETLHPL